ncbi:MAG: hypothetical protein KAU95_03885 [Candidatus Aenigmarchaeota archaeon]|nr:hypothetical protein [Candidatus Aenigmarchaeota archaeon]
MVHEAILDNDKNEWRLVLNEIYKDKWIIYSVKEVDEKHPLAKELKISGRSLQKTLSFLEGTDLIKIKEDNFIYLTQKGFNVARENEHMVLSETLQFLIVYFTTIIALTTMCNFFQALKLISPQTLLMVYAVSICLVFLLIYIFHKRRPK